MTDIVPPSRQALTEALVLAADILRNIELSEIQLSTVALKASRLARILNDFDHQKVFEYEAAGYPSTPAGVTQGVWELARLAGRVYQVKVKEEIKEHAYIDSIAAIEQQIKVGEASLEAARDPNVALSSANPSQYVGNPIGNRLERERVRKVIATASSRLSSRTGFLYSYASQRYYEIKFSGIADEIFSRVREVVDQRLSAIVPTSVQKISAIYDNLSSENPEDWSNAVHGCRRLLQDLADALLPPTVDRIVMVGGKEKPIKMGANNYINRLMAFIEARSASERFTSLVGSNLGFIGDRLDSVFQAAQKGSHATIHDRSEADRYVIYTYMIVGDIIGLVNVAPKIVNASDSGKRPSGPEVQ